jgi:hypothetical protein
VTRPSLCQPVDRAVSHTRASPHRTDRTGDDKDFFTRHGLALPTDQAERLAAGQRRIDAVPEARAHALDMPRPADLVPNRPAVPKSRARIEAQDH